ncbi:MAG TPA: hypothetical protein PKB10_02460 [Tepidisphaeraceae bacterium]|nr:hypothetical protein [Tepidisphaeraceae bacterium]
MGWQRRRYRPAPAIPRLLKPEDLARFIDEERGWVFGVSRITLERPVTLSSRPLPGGRVQQGLLDLSAEQMLKELGGEILRKQIVFLEGTEAGVLAISYGAGARKQLGQRAIVRASDRVWYVVNFTIPAPADDLDDDPAVRHAVATFNAMLDTVRLIDLTRVREDQEDRLLRTRSLLLNFTESRLRATIVPEQWFRLLRDGKDIGYTYVVEEIATDVPRRGVKPPPGGKEGILTGARPRPSPDPDEVVDSESWMWMSFDRRQESWSNNVVFNRDEKNEDWAMELGLSIMRTRPIDSNRLIDEWKLDVRYGSRRVGLQNIEREFPPFYFPQALSHLVTRLLPLRDPKTYLIAVYNSDQHEVTLRYLDVKPLGEVMFNRQSLVAIAIEDRAGLRSAPTVHYFTPEGRYLGSENKEASIVVLPTTPAELRTIWKDADLSRPEAVKE